MKSKVKLSKFSTIITYGVILLFVVCIIASWDERNKVIIAAVILIAMIAVSLFFYPKSIEATDSKVIIHRQFGDTSIANTDIAAVERCYPSAGGLRLCGSGGFFGYWGYFTDIMIGNYFGYYGDRSQCILICLKDGTQYVVSCEHPDDMVEAITRHLKSDSSR